MSWSLNVKAKSDDPATVKAEFDKINTLAEPERSIKDKAGELALLAMQGQKAGTNVLVVAYGSANTEDNTQVSNTISVSVTPQAADAVQDVQGVQVPASGEAAAEQNVAEQPTGGGA